MCWPRIACLFLASLLPLCAEDWTTEDGKTYKNVTVVGQEDDGVRITYDGGVGKIPYYELPVDIQKRFGQDVDSLSAKKRAVDQAIDAAVNAAAAQSVMLPTAVPGQMPSTALPASVPSIPAPGSVGPGSPAPTATSPTGPAPAGNALTATSPSTNPPGTGAPGAVPSGTPAKPVPGTAAAPGVPPHPGAVPPTATAANPAAAGKAGAGSDSVELPSLNEPASPTPQPPGINAAGGKPLQLVVATYSYNEALDVCYLDSPPVDVYPGPLTSATAPSAQGSSLTLRIVTEGNTPQIPDRFELTLLCVGGTNSDLGLADTTFTTETGTFSVVDSNRKDSGSLPGGQGMKYASFYLSAAQVREICSGKPLTFTVGADLYHIDARGSHILQTYLADTDSLEPATSSLLYSFYKLLGRIPSFFTIISTICEYVILGSFALLVAASIAAFILGISRFIKM